MLKFPLQKERGNSVTVAFFVTNFPEFQALFLERLLCSETFMYLSYDVSTHSPQANVP